MKKAVLIVVALLAAAVSAHALPVQVVLTTTAKSTTTTPAPTALYGLEMVLQLPVGVTAKLAPSTTGEKLLDPATINLADNSTLNTGTQVSAALIPATSATVGDTVKLLVVNPYGFRFGIFGNLWFDFKPGFTATYNSTTGAINSANFKVLSFLAIDATGNTIPSTQATGSISKSYVWK